MQERQLWKLVAGKLTGEASGVELYVLGKYLQDNKCVSNCVDILTKFWQAPIDKDDKMPELAFEKLLEKIHAD